MLNYQRVTQAIFLLGISIQASTYFDHPSHQSLKTPSHPGFIAHEISTTPQEKKTVVLSLTGGIVTDLQDNLTGAKRREWMGCWGLLG